MSDEDMILAIEGQMKGILKDLKALRKGTQSQTEATEELGDAAEDTGKKLKNAFDIKQLGAWVLSIQKYMFDLPLADIHFILFSLAIAENISNPELESSVIISSNSFKRSLNPSTLS